MKKTLLLPFLLFTLYLANGQQVPKAVLPQAKYPAMASPSPGGLVADNLPPSVPAASFRMLEESIGVTTFEAQTANTMGRHVADFGNGGAGAIWHFGGVQAGGYPDRGTGYNYFDGENWGPHPTTSFEAVRSGYPSYTVTASGMEAAISHKSPDGVIWTLTVHTKQQGEATWTEHEIPTAAVNGNVWGKIAAGGQDGNTLHVLAAALSPAFGGVVHEGVDGHPLYFRSSDGGQTWEVQDFIIPGIDKDFYRIMNSDAYSIEAEGETVAIAVFPTFGDIAIAKSTDNGDTWDKTIVRDFPLDLYDEMGYDSTEIPDDPDAPGPNYILNTDGAGALVVDDAGMAHVFFSWMYWQHTIADGYQLDLGTNGIAYWNESMPTDGMVTISNSQDFDGNGMLDIDGTTLGTIRYGNAGLASHPAAAKDGEGNLYLVHQAIREDFLNVDDFNYRHLFVLKSENGGASWSEPFDLINTNVTPEPEFIEAAYPAIPAVIGDVIHLTYLQDVIPGQTVANGTVPDQNVMYAALDKTTFATISGASLLDVVNASLRISPNPATGLAQVRYDLPKAAEVQFQVSDLLGKRVLVVEKGTQAAGPHVQPLQLSGLAGGVYFVQLKMGGDVVVRKLVVR